MRKITALLLVVAVALILPACSAAQTAENSDTVTMQVVLDWTPNTNHTGLYVAKELGYYQEAGLTIEIIQPPEDGALALVGAGKADFCVDFQESLGPALTASSPLPVTAVAAIVSHNTSGIISLQSENIQSPKDLEGKRFAAWSSPLVDAIMRTVIEEDGGDISQVEMLPNTVTDVISALQADIDAVWIFEAWDGVAVNLSGAETNYIAFADLDPTFDFYTPILVANNALLESSPEQVTAFMAATSRGYSYAVQHPQEAAEILLKHAPELSEDLVLASQQLLSAKYQADAPYWGYIDTERWAGFYRWMFAEGLLEKELGEAGFSNEYLPEYSS